MYNIIHSKNAIKDLGEISSYISLNNPIQAIRVIENIKGSIEYLKLFPLLGKERKDGLREIVIKYKYRVFYKIENTTIYIISIFKYKDAF